MGCGCQEDVGVRMTLGWVGADEKRIGESHLRRERWRWGGNNRRRGAGAGL